MATTTQRTTQHKIDLFRRYFSGLTDIYGTYDLSTGRVYQVKQPVTDRVIYRHLAGKQPYGVYLLMEAKTGALAVDFDTDELTGPVAFVDSARQYGLAAYIERSKAKGYHVWIFFENPVSAKKARTVIRYILKEIGRDPVEIFPKQDCLDGRTGYGNFINAPLFGRLVPRGRTVFVDPADPTKPCPDPWAFLEQIRRVSETILDELITLNPMEPSTSSPSEVSMNEPETADREFNFGLTPCARRILSVGVTAFQRVTCFRLAIHLHRLGLPMDIAIAALKRWAAKNRPVFPKRQISEREIEAQVTDAYSKQYMGLGCTEPAIVAFCDPKCPIYRKE